MCYDPDRHHRHSVRLKGFDYSQPGFYYVTICSHKRVEILGKIVDHVMINNQVGEMVNRMWKQIPNWYENVVLDCYQIMPNHIHGIIHIRRRGGVTPPINDHAKSSCENVPNKNPFCDMPTIEGAETTPLPPVPTLGQLVGRFKYQATKAINKMHKTPGNKVFQRGFYDRIIRGKTSLIRTRKYIIENPEKWLTDELNPVK